MYVWMYVCVCACDFVPGFYSTIMILPLFANKQTNNST